MADGSDDITLRAATMADAERIRDLINEVDLEDTGIAEYSLDEVVEDLSGPDTHLPSDSWLAFAGDRLVAYGIIWNELRTERIDVDHYVLAEYCSAGEHLIDVMTERCAEIAAENGADTAVIHLNLTPTAALAQGSLPDRGWRVVRRHNVMKRAVDASEPAVELPLGVAVRNPSSGDKPIVHRLLQESFSEHFDHHERSYDEWLAQGRDRYDEQLSWIASLDGEDVGVVLSRNNREAMGWVRALGVLQGARGRGVASALLRLAFAGFAAAGRDTVGLGVDTQNVTNALRLYESLGMTLHYAVDSWERRVPARARAAAS